MKSASRPVRTRTYRMQARAEAARATADRVLDTAVELFSESPYEDVSLEAIAHRSHVTARTVSRRFGSKEALFVQAMDRAALQAQRERDEAPVGDVPEAVRYLVAQYERWGTNRLLMLSQEDRIPVVAENVRDGRRYHWSWVERTFAPLLVSLRGTALRRRKAALVAATDVYVWKVLRRDLGLSRRATEQAIVDLIDNAAESR